MSTSSLHPAEILFRFIREIPLVWFLIGCLLAWIGLSLRSIASPQHRPTLLRKIAFAAGLFVLLAYLFITLASLRCFLIQQDEANILSIAAAGLRGRPVYHPPISPDFSYSLMYGPVTFLIYSWALLAGGAKHFWIIRGAVVGANLAFVVALYLLIRKFVPRITAVALLAFPLSVLIQHPEISLSVRSDIWIILCATLSILCSLWEVELLAAILTGLLGGIIIGLKISAAPAMFFPMLLLYRRFGLRSLGITVLAAAASAFAPFVLSSISLHNYISWLLFTRSEGISIASASANVVFALFLISPCLIMELFLRRSGKAFRHRLPEFLIILLCLALAVLTSKNGSGPHYLWHIVPSIVVYLALVARDISETPSSERDVPLYIIAVACALFACVNIPRAWQHVSLSLMPRDMGVAQQSIDRYLNLYHDRSSIQMGYGTDTDFLPDLRYMLVYQGQPYTVEGNTGRFETRLLPFPINVLHRMESCTDDVWLIPHAQQPFEIWVFPDSLHTVFLKNYRVDRSDAMYDAWICDRAPKR